MREIREEIKGEIVIKLLEGKSKSQIARELGCTRDTVYAALREMNLTIEDVFGKELGEFRLMQIDALQDMADRVEKGEVNPKVATAWNALQEHITKLMGTAAPSKSLSVRVDAHTSPVFLRFKKACSGLRDDQLESVFAFASQLPREKLTEVMDASWFPQPEKKGLPDEIA